MTDPASPHVASPGIATVRVPAQESSGLDARLINQYRQRGWVLLENVVERADLDAAAVRLSTLSTMGRSDRYSNSGRVDFTKIPNLSKNDEAFRRLASSPRLVAAVEALLAQPALIFRDVVIAKPAREGAPFTYHQDSEYWDVRPNALLSAWIPFRDVGIEDGCLCVIESSHLKHYPHDLLLGEGRAMPRWVTGVLRKMASLAGTGDSDASGLSAMRTLKRSVLGDMTRHFSLLARLQELHARVPDEEKSREISLPVRAGSAILFHSMLLHASHPNRSDRDRLAYIASYMGADYTFCGVGNPEFLVASELSSRVFQKVKVAHS
jgi:ectoine hydroxylase-related dioxygenase (phytanoyl-CoA dioxygenase family)